MSFGRHPTAHTYMAEQSAHRRKTLPVKETLDWLIHRLAPLAVDAWPGMGPVKPALLNHLCSVGEREFKAHYPQQLHSVGSTEYDSRMVLLLRTAYKALLRSNHTEPGVGRATTADGSLVFVAVDGWLVMIYTAAQRSTPGSMLAGVKAFAPGAGDGEFHAVTCDAAALRKLVALLADPQRGPVAASLAAARKAYLVLACYEALETAPQPAPADVVHCVAELPPQPPPAPDNSLYGRMRRAVSWLTGGRSGGG